RLHLLQAQSGVADLGEGREVRYDSLGSQHLRRWTVHDGGSTLRTMWHVADQLILADEQGVQLRTVNVPPATFTTTPPTTHDEWARLGARLNPQPVAADDLQAMFNQFPGAVQRLPRAGVRELRLGATGFRFILDLPDGGRPDSRLTSGLAAGSYLVTYEPGRGYDLQAMTPPALDLHVTAQPWLAAARQPIDFGVRIGNAGLTDLGGLRVELLASLEGEGGSQPRSVGFARLDALAGTSSVVSFRWTPPEGGRWTFQVRALLGADPTGSAEVDSGGTVVATESLTVPVAAASAPPTWLAIPGGGQYFAGTAALLAGLGTVAGTLALLAARATNRGM
ncbi:MAG TPA: hypothetical protein VHN78_02750, partial [Chloroflexota bacterium]|nr:hypothetical protein [Chloroflexota bacterium]